MEFQKAHAIGNGGAALADFGGDFFLLEAELAGQPAVGGGFFNGIEIGALDVLNQGQLEHLLITGSAHDDRGFREPDFLGGPPSALAGDELVFAGYLADDQRLDDSPGADGVDQLVEPFALELGAGLERGGDDFREGDLLDALAGFGQRSGRAHAGVDESVESFAEREFRHKGASMT